MESIAMPIISHTHCGLNAASVEKNIRRRMANAAPLGAIERKAVMGVGAPWYVSGIQECSGTAPIRSEEHTSELQSQSNLVCRLLLEKKNIHIVLLAASLGVGIGFYGLAVRTPTGRTSPADTCAGAGVAPVIALARASLAPRTQMHHC